MIVEKDNFFHPLSVIGPLGGSCVIRCEVKITNLHQKCSEKFYARLIPRNLLNTAIFTTAKTQRVNYVQLSKICNVKPVKLILL